MRLLIRDGRSLPGDYLPAAISFDKGAGVQMIRNCLRTVDACCRADKFERDDRGITVLLYADVF